MGFLKVLDNINGMMVALTKEILSKDSEVGTVYGVSGMESALRIIKAIMQWIRNQVMGFINGKMDGFTKETSKMTIGMGMDNSMMESNVFIAAFGWMDSKFSQKRLGQASRLEQLRAYKWAKPLLAKAIKDNTIIHLTWKIIKDIKWINI